MNKSQSPKRAGTIVKKKAFPAELKPTVFTPIQISKYDENNYENKIKGLK